MIALALESRSALQRAFAEAILSDDAPIPATVRAASGPAHASRFGVYRNNVMASLINAVAARYPVVRKLLWDDAFNRAAHLYVTRSRRARRCCSNMATAFRIPRGIGQGPRPTISPTLPSSKPPARGPITPPTRCRCRGKLSRRLRRRIAGFAIKLHPSVTLLKSRFPVVSIWEANLYANDNTLGEWKPECALVARPIWRSRFAGWRPGGYEFFAALAEGQTVGSAIARAMATSAGFRSRRMLQRPDRRRYRRRAWSAGRSGC